MGGTPATLQGFCADLSRAVLTNAPPLDPAGIVSVGFLISDKQEGPFKLEVAWIKASPIVGK